MVTAIIAFISLVLMISGLVLKNVLLLLTSVISWIIFAFLMYDYAFTNTAINTGLLMFGGAMAIVCAISTLGIFMSRRPKRMSLEDEQRVHRQKVQKVTQRRKY